MRIGDLNLFTTGTGARWSTNSSRHSWVSCLCVAVLLGLAGCDAPEDTLREVIELSRVHDEDCEACRLVTIETLEHAKIEVRVSASPDLVVERKDIQGIELRETQLLDRPAMQVSAAITPAAGARVRKLRGDAGDEARVLVSFAGRLSNLAEARHLGTYLPLGFHSAQAVDFSSALFHIVPPEAPSDSGRALRDRYDEAVRESRALLEQND